MNPKVSFATSMTTTMLFVVFASTKIQFLFFSAFIILLAKGIKMYIEFTNEDAGISEEQPIKNLNKLILFRFLMQLIPILYIVICFYILFLRQQLWK